MIGADQPVHGTQTVRPDTDRCPLSELLDRKGRLEPARAAGIGLRLLDVLSAAHTKGITHGDLTPARVLLLPDDEIVLSGFGPTGTDPSRPVTDPAFASPEQVRGDRGTPESDLWSLGAILFVMVEGHPPHPDWSGLDVTRAGPLTQVIQGLLRPDPPSRLTEPLVRQALTRALNQDRPADTRTAPRLPWLHGTYEALWPCGHRRDVRKVRPAVALAAGLALVSVVSVVALASTGTLTGGDNRASGPTRSASPPNGAPPSLPREPTPPKTSPPSPSPPSGPSDPSAPAAPSAPATPSDPPGKGGGGGGGDEPAGFVRYTAEAEGFSIDLPKGWKRVESGSRFHVKFASPDEDDNRDLVVTFGKDSEDEDPVEVWKSLVPSLEKFSPGFQRIDDIRRVDYRDWDAADMTWSSAIGGDPFRTFGRGFLVGGGRGFSIRWTTPADEADSTENEKALDIFLKSFEETKD
ncbi:serine/threonine protein kinase [Streptomyces sp. NA02950]|uniref:serine/threonine-protein kinase n=1 Tax=Streptomyces sp. NA02950 TaxID=2742137 RepID=UPI00158FD1D2|nr:serine/threonine protein kinase [Streptomyces sp. NA02950]QKV94457.1 serine/threonine protein kinase [Streptomyces sp. NA02950]